MSGALGNLVVFLPVSILRPPVEPETNDRDFALLPSALNEHRTKVACPASIGGEAKELDSSEIGACAREHSSPARFVCLRVGDHSNDLVGSELLYNLGVYPGNHREFSRPVASIVGPANPCRFVRLPLGRPAKGRLSQMSSLRVLCVLGASAVNRSGAGSHRRDAEIAEVTQRISGTGHSLSSV